MSAVPPPSPPDLLPTSRPALTAVPKHEFFEAQPTSTSRLPDPLALVENLSGGVVEVLAGARDLEQIGRWMTEPVYRHLLRRVVLAQRGRDLKRIRAARPVYTITRTRITTPADGVVEASVVVEGRARTRAIAMRLEGFDDRWRATAIHVL